MPGMLWSALRKRCNMAAELITNGTFDSDVSGWTTTNCTAASVASRMQVTAPISTSVTDSYVSTTFQVTAGQHYTVSFDGSCALEGTTGSVSISTASGLWGYEITLGFELAATSVTFIAAETGEATLSLNVGGHASEVVYVFDNVSVQSQGCNHVNSTYLTVNASTPVSATMTGSGLTQVTVKNIDVDGAVYVRADEQAAVAQADGTCVLVGAGDSCVVTVDKTSSILVSAIGSASGTIGLHAT